MSERTYTDKEAKALAVEAAQEALRRYAAEHPHPSCVTAVEAAKMMQLSVRTVAKLNLPRNKAGKIPYSAVLDAIAKR